MFKLTVATAAAVLVFGLAASAAPMAGAPDAPADGAMIPAAAKKSGVIPANCTIDPWKKVYVCCTSPDSCTEHPLDTDWPLSRQLRQHLQQVKPMQSPPLTADPSVSQ
jgi:hypothetical protein